MTTSSVPCSASLSPLRSSSLILRPSKSGVMPEHHLQPPSTYGPHTPKNSHPHQWKEPKFAMPPITPLDVAYLQSKAEILEMEARIASEESQKTAEQQFGQIFDNKGVRVTHACEHCRQRKAKCTGTQPCKRCTKQGRLCTFSKIEKKRKVTTSLRELTQIPNEGTDMAGWESAVAMSREDSGDPAYHHFSSHGRGMRYESSPLTPVPRHVMGYQQTSMLVSSPYSSPSFTSHSNEQSILEANSHARFVHGSPHHNTSPEFSDTPLMSPAQASGFKDGLAVPSFEGYDGRAQEYCLTPEYSAAGVDTGVNPYSAHTPYLKRVKTDDDHEAKRFKIYNPDSLGSMDVTSVATDSHELHLASPMKRTGRIATEADAVKSEAGESDHDSSGYPESSPLSTIPPLSA